MIVLSALEANELKEAVRKNCSADVHFHDCCGGQSFSLDQPNDAVKKFLQGYLLSQHRCAVFGNDGVSFRIEEA